MSEQLSANSDPKLGASAYKGGGSRCEEPAVELRCPESPAGIIFQVGFDLEHRESGLSVPSVLAARKGGKRRQIGFTSSVFIHLRFSNTTEYERELNRNYHLYGNNHRGGFVRHGLCEVEQFGLF